MPTCYGGWDEHTEENPSSTQNSRCAQALQACYDPVPNCRSTQVLAAGQDQKPIQSLPSESNFGTNTLDLKLSFITDTVLIIAHKQLVFTEPHHMLGTLRDTTWIILIHLLFTDTMTNLTCHVRKLRFRQIKLLFLRSHINRGQARMQSPGDPQAVF